MCSLHLTHPSAHTPGAVGSWHCGARGAVGGSVPCSRVSPQSWTLPARAGIRTHNLGLPQVASPTLYPLGHDCPRLPLSNALFTLYFLLNKLMSICSYTFGLFRNPSHSLYSAKLSTTKSWRAIETEKKTQQRKLMSNYVKLKWLNLQNHRSFFCCLLQLSLSWMFERTEQRPTSSSNPTQAHNLSISAFSHSARLPIKSADHYRHGDRRLGDIKQAFRTAVTHWRKEFTSLLKLT